MVARRHWYVRSHDGQFYDAPAVDARILRLGLDSAGTRGGRSVRNDGPPPTSGRERNLLDVYGLVPLKERKCGGARERLFDIPDHVVSSQHAVLRGQGKEGVR